jgi:DNA-binding LacI/PurR family transcriptional regulator
MTLAAGFDCAVVLTDPRRQATSESTASFLQEAERLGINVVKELVIPADVSDRDGYRQVLLDAWDQGVGVIVVNL